MSFGECIDTRKVIKSGKVVFSQPLTKPHVIFLLMVAYFNFRFPGKAFIWKAREHHQQVQEGRVGSGEGAHEARQFHVSFATAREISPW